MIKINPDFQKLIPPLSSEEKQQLENNLVADGCRDPLVLWGDTLIDGHNRYEICTRLNIPYQTISKEFESENAVKLWMIDNQRGRRNLTDGWRFQLVQAKKEILSEIGRAKKIETLKQNSDSPVLSIVDKTVSEPKHDTRAEIAKDLGWSTGKVGMADVVFKEAEKKPELKEKVLSGEVSINEAYKEIKAEKKSEKLAEKKQEIIATTAKAIEEKKPVLYREHYRDFFNRIEDKSQDLLITDPPYSTDIEDIAAFANDWLLPALSKVKDTGRAYICIGAYPKELQAYLNLLLQQDRFVVDNPLIWTYRNTLGITPKDKYNLNYQVILHLYGKDSAELDTSITNEMFSVQDINAPDGRQGDRYHTWQKPIELGLRLIRHSTKENDFIFDPFSCTGTFAIAAAKLNRNATGCDISEDNLKIAESRGCNVVY